MLFKICVKYFYVKFFNIIIMSMNNDFYGNVPEIDKVSPAEVQAKSRNYYPKAPSFEKKVTKLLDSKFNMQAFAETRKLREGQLFQLQNPSEKNVYVVDLGYDFSKRKPNMIDDIFVALGDESGCFNYVATYQESKNSGSYQRFAKRVLESRTYMIVRRGKSYVAEQLLGNREWLKLDKCTQAVDKIVKFHNSHVLDKALRLKPLTEMGMFECILHLDKGMNPHLKAVRIQTYVDAKGVKVHFAISMNSGKMWVLNDKQLEAVADVSRKNCIMTNFIMIKKTGGDGNYAVVA